MSLKGPHTGLPWLQLVAGALAAMTSAWVASYLGVAGTIIGAAVGSLVASVASAFYVRGLDKGTTFITESGSVVSRPRPADASGADDKAEADVLVTEDESSIVVEESERAFSWKRILVWSALALGAALLAIGAFELVTGSSFGNADNPSIGRPWQGSSAGGEQESPADPATEETSEPADEPTDRTTTPAPAPTTPPTTAPPVAPAPAPAPVPTEAPLPEADPQLQE